MEKTIKKHFAVVNGKRKLIKAYKRQCNNQYTKKGKKK